MLDVVREEQEALIEAGLPNTYLPIRGLPAYRDLTQKMVFGEQSEVVQSGRACTIQALGGTGAIKLAADFMRNVCGATVGASSDPTWGNHDGIMRLAGMQVQKYRYYDAAHFCVDFSGMLEDVAKLPAGAMPIFHSCCHNPTGYDLTLEQWTQLLELCRSHGLVPLLDMAYQGFRDGLDADAAAIRLFAESDLDFLVATSYSKSFGLYSERVGALTVVTGSKKQADAVTTRIEALARANYSNPPSFARVGRSNLQPCVTEFAQCGTHWFKKRKRLEPNATLVLSRVRAECSPLRALHPSRWTVWQPSSASMPCATAVSAFAG